MILVKTDKEIEIMRQGGRRLALVMEKVIKKARIGVTTKELDRLAEELIKKQGGKPSFKGFNGYKWATCMSVNEGVVHGIPNKEPLKGGDILTVDMGMRYRDWHTDTAYTLKIQNPKSKIQNNNVDKFLSVGKLALEKAIGITRVGNRVGHISQVIQQTIEQAGYSPVRDLVGHGVGKQLHEEPEVPCWLDVGPGKTTLLQKGMVLAIEVIYSQGKPEVVYSNEDGWTLKTADNSLSAMFEHTVAVTKADPQVLTSYRQSETNHY